MSPEQLLPSKLRGRLEALAFNPARPLAGRMQGERRSPRRGQSVEFADYRGYSRGDDLRRVDWNAYARLEKFVVKLFVAEEDIALHLAVDASRSMGVGLPAKLDTALRLAAPLGYVGLIRQDWVNLVPFGDRPHPGPRALRGRSGVAELLDHLTRIAPDGGTNLALSVGAYAQSVRPAGAMVILTDLFDPNWRQGVGRAVAAGFDVTLLHILAPDELEPTLDGDLRLIDSESGDRVDVTVDAALRQEYRVTLAEWLEDTRRWCAGRGVLYETVASDVDVETLVLGALRRRALLV